MQWLGYRLWVSISYNDAISELSVREHTASLSLQEFCCDVRNSLNEIPKNFSGKKLVYFGPQHASAILKTLKLRREVIVANFLERWPLLQPNRKGSHSCVSTYRNRISGSWKTCNTMDIVEPDFKEKRRQSPPCFWKQLFKVWPLGELTSPATTLCFIALDSNQYLKNIFFWIPESLRSCSPFGKQCEGNIWVT